jgi:hypothetical protein
MPDPRTLVAEVEANPQLPEGTDERFSGYGVMGLPFRSGHILALRRFPVTSVGPGYTSVWHRAPSGDWTFYQDAPGEQACPRYFGSRLLRAIQRQIDLRWTGPNDLSISIDGGKFLDWSVTLDSPLAIRTMNAMAGMMPKPWWRKPSVLRMMGVMASGMLGAGRMGLEGHTPNGQYFVANPLVAWNISSSRAQLEGVSLGEVGPVAEQDRLGDFWIPQRGIFAIGQAFFETFDPSRHQLKTHA